MVRLLVAQVRRIETRVVVAPVAAGMLLALAGWGATWVWPSWQAMTLMAWLVQVQVICSGVSVAIVVAGDPMIELHESTPIGYRASLFVRAGIVTVSGLTGAVVFYAALLGASLWPTNSGWGTMFSQVSAVIVLAVVAVTVAAFTGTVSSTTVAVITAWMFLSMLWDPYVPSLLPGRGIPLLIVAFLLVAGWRRLGNTEHNIRKVAPI